MIKAKKNIHLIKRFSFFLKLYLHEGKSKQVPTKFVVRFLLEF